jgi:hypothetical protein
VTTTLTTTSGAPTGDGQEAGVERVEACAPSCARTEVGSPARRTSLASFQSIETTSTTSSTPPAPPA